MYDLEKDPMETVNLADLQPVLTRELKEAAERLFATLQPLGPVKESRPMDENIRRELRGLGYLQ